MAMDWIVGWWSTAYSTSAGTAVYLQLISGSELEDKGDNLVVERIVGQYYFANADATGASHLMHTRIVVRPEALPAGPFVNDITTADGAEERFLWHKVHKADLEGFGTGAANLGMLCHPEWSHLDVKVNRRMGDNDVLLFIFQPTVGFFGETNDVFNYAAWIRVLVKY